MSISKYGSQSFAVAILDDDEREGPETFVVRLSHASGGSVIGTVSELTVTIVDNEVGLLSVPARVLLYLLLSALGISRCRRSRALHSAGGVA